MKRILALILALLTAASLSACEKSDGRVKKGSMTFTNRNFPKICTDGLSKRHAAVLAGAALGERKDDFAVMGLEAGIESLVSGGCDIFIAAVPTAFGQRIAAVRKNIRRCAGVYDRRADRGADPG